MLSITFFGGFTVVTLVTPFERGLGGFDNLFSKKIQLFLMNYSLFIKKVCIYAIFVVPLHRICKRMQLKQQY